MLQEAAHKSGDLDVMGFKGEVSGVEQMDLCCPQVATIGIRARRDEVNRDNRNSHAFLG
jgi:hypothetical protein